MTLLENIAWVFSKTLDDWLGQPDEPFLNEIELPVDPTTIRQVLRESIHRTKVRAWGQIELCVRRVEISDTQLSYLTWDECCPEETPLPVQAIRFFDKVQALCDPVERADLGIAFAQVRNFLNKKLEGNSTDAGVLTDAARNPSQTQGIVEACDSLIENLRKTVGVDDGQISDLEDIRDAVRGSKPLASAIRTLFHDGFKDTRSGLVACVAHAVDLAKRGWKIVDTDVTYNDHSCEVCAVGLDDAIKQAKGYSST